MHALNWIDIVCLVVVGLSALLSLVRGFVREVLSLIVWVVALLAAIFYANRFAGHFHVFSDDHSIQYALSFACVFLVILLAGLLISAILVKLVQKSELDLMDRLLGLIFGALRGLVILLVMTFIAEVTTFTQQNAWQQSYFGPYLVRAVHWVKPHLPRKLNQKLDFNHEQNPEKVNPEKVN